MSDNLKVKIKSEIDRNIYKRAKLLQKADKIGSKIRAFESVRSKIYKKEKQLREITEQLVNVYNADDAIVAFNTLQQQRLARLRTNIQQST